MATLAQPSITRPSWGSLELGDPSTSSPRSAYRHGKQYSLPPNQASPPNSNNVRPPKSRHVFGLSLLTKTPDAKKHDKAKTVDIVAIHGINGHALNTWKAEGGALWLRDFMCKDIRSARVFTFGYDAQLLFTESHASLQKFAASLLDELMVARGGVLPTRTLVFICHGMGGFIAKEVSSMTSEYLYISISYLHFGYRL